MTGAYFRDRTGLCVCLVPGCDWKYLMPPALGLGPEESVEFAHRLIKGHRETFHPYLQLQVQKCPLRGCAWEDSTWSVPGITYRQDTHRLQRNWSKHMTHTHPSVRGPGTIQVTARLYPYNVPSADDRMIAEGALGPLREEGVPIVNAAGEPVGRVTEQREEDDWLVVEGFLREDLIADRDADNLWRGRVLPVSFAVRPQPFSQFDGPLRITEGELLNVRVTDGDETVWEGTGMRALHPRLDADPAPEQTDTPEPPSEGETRDVGITGIDQLAMKAAVQGVSASLRPLQDAMEAWAAALTPAIQAFADALTEHAKAIAVKPEPMIIKVAAADADFLEEHAPNPETRYTCACPGLPVPHVPGGPSCLRRPPSARQWDSLYGQVPTAPEGPEDWPRLPRDGKRAPTGCDACEAPVDGRHPRGCPGA